MTHHLPNYHNEKWGPFGRWLLRRGEWAGMAFAHGRIAVASGLAKEMTRRYRVPVDTIPNGIDPPAVVRSADILRAFGLAPNLYAVTVARIDEQKRQLDLIAAYARLDQPEWKLALVGGADYSGTYARAVAEAARQTPGVVMLGHQTGAALAALYSNAGVFVLPSSHEGQPIAVLEAASFGLPAILSDIAAHRELALPRARYVVVGDIAGLADHLQAAFTGAGSGKTRRHRARPDHGAHDWQTIARRTLAVYRDALSGAKSGKRGHGSPIVVRRCARRHLNAVAGGDHPEHPRPARGSRSFPATAALATPRTRSP